MKKKYFILYVFVFAFLISFIRRILVLRNLKKNPLVFTFLRPNGSYVNFRTIVKRPES